MLGDIAPSYQQIAKHTDVRNGAGILESICVEHIRGIHWCNASCDFDIQSCLSQHNAFTYTSECSLLFQIIGFILYLVFSVSVLNKIITLFILRRKWCI